MVELVENGVQYSVRPPLLYLDHCSLRGVAGHPARRQQFRRILETKGTLLFSWMNAAEMAPNSGQSADDMRSFLDEVGPHWLMLDNDPFTVAEREARGVPPPQVFFDEGFFKGWWVATERGPLLLGSMLELAQLPEFKTMWDERRASLGNVTVLLREARRRLREGTYQRKLGRDASRPTLSSYNTLVSALIKDGKTIETNDVCDLLHAAVSLQHAHWVVLDGAWANYARQLKRDKFVRVFPVNKLDEGLDFLEHLRVVHVD